MATAHNIKRPVLSRLSNYLKCIVDVIVDEKRIDL